MEVASTTTTMTMIRTDPAARLHLMGQNDPIDLNDPTDLNVHTELNVPTDLNVPIDPNDPADPNDLADPTVKTKQRDQILSIDQTV